MTPPFTVLVDGREKAPYQFRGLRASARFKYAPLDVPVEWAYLETGDYSVKGCEHLVAVERKSKEDLYSSLGRHHDREERKHERLSRMDFAAFVVAASLLQVLEQPPERSEVLPKSIYRTCLAWSIRYRIPWFFCDSRRLAEVTTFRLLERWWYDFQERVSENGEECRVCGRPLRAHRSWERGLGPVCAERGERLLAARMRRGEVSF